MTLHAKVKEELERTYERLSGEGKIKPSGVLATCYDTFRRRFGPQVLGVLDGETLLTTLKPGGNHDSLAYWLEFKDDEEFPGVFGSIAGGSALKFGVYWSNTAGSWMTGSPLAQNAIDVTEAIAIARRDRDQLLRAVELIADLPSSASDDDYLDLQVKLDQAAPDIRESAWAHKYFCLLFPAKISDIHVVWHQQLQLIRLLQVPPSPSGRYVCEGRYVALANEIGIPLHPMMTVVYSRNGPIHSYWRFEFSGEPSLGDNWEFMRQNATVALGWPECGDLSGLLSQKNSKFQLRQLVQATYGQATAADRTQQLFDLAKGMTEGDIVLVAHGPEVIAIGEVAGTYAFVGDSPLPHRRPVAWRSLERWQIPKPASTKRPVDRIDFRQDAASLVQIEQHLLEASSPPDVQGCTPGHADGPPAPRLVGPPGRIQAALERKGQVIVYGPPGTGKTFWALQTARQLAAHSHFGADYAKLSSEQQSHLDRVSPAAGCPIRFCTFHPGYGYEDFIEGLRPEIVEGQATFANRAGIFRRLCTDAAQQPDHDFYLIIDEINRGDIPRIFGELLTLLEKDKRGLHLQLPMSGSAFAVPKNIYVIGTMNTADRSIALVDTALRRRFAFVELMPDSGALNGVVLRGIPLGRWLDALNARIRANVGRDARNLQVGHAYLLIAGIPIADFALFARVLREDILPLLQEYCYEDYSALERILGPSLVDVSAQRFRDELFAPTRYDDLVQALLAPAPELTASPEVIQASSENGDAGREMVSPDIGSP